MKHLFKSLAAFQQEVPVIHKGSQGYGYSYADLPTIFEVINPLLKKHGLGFTQPMSEGNKIKTIVFHIESGETLESITDIPSADLRGQNEYQTLGSAITYLRRYALSSLLGLVTDKDTDGATKKEPVKQNTGKVDPKLLKSISDKLSKVNKVDELTEVKKQYASEIKAYPSIKAMLNSKYHAINGNA